MALTHGIKLPLVHTCDTQTGPVTFLGIEVRRRSDRLPLAITCKQSLFRLLLTGWPSFASSLPRHCYKGRVVASIVRAFPHCALQNTPGCQLPRTLSVYNQPDIATVTAAGPPACRRTATERELPAHYGCCTSVSYITRPAFSRVSSRPPSSFTIFKFGAVFHLFQFFAPIKEWACSDNRSALLRNGALHGHYKTDSARLWRVPCQYQCSAEFCAAIIKGTHGVCGRGLFRAIITGARYSHISPSPLQCGRLWG